MRVMSLMNETALAPGTGGLALNSFRIFSEPALYQRGPRLHPCCTPRADSTANRSLDGSRACKFDASGTTEGTISASASRNLWRYILVEAFAPSCERMV